MTALYRLLALFLLLAATSAKADIILLLSDEKPSITGVAQAIQAAHGSRIETYNLRGDPVRVADIALAVQASDKRQVIAVGLLAAQLARQHLVGKQIVFCQVLNYEESNLITPRMKGVSALPSLAKQFQTWKILDPRLRQVGVITGKSMREMVKDARVAARASNIELVHVEVASDREMLPALQQLSEQIQGFWLAPDSSILSAAAIRSTLSYSSKRGIGALVFSPGLLREGGLLSATPSFSEIAQLTLARLKSARDTEDIPGEPVLPLSSAKLTINAKAAQALGLTLPDHLRGIANVE